MRRALAIFVVTGALAMGVGARAQTAAQPAPQPDAQAQIEATLDTCFKCHGPGGVSRIPTRPTIAGQKADYVKRQLHIFKRAAAEHVADTDGDADDGLQAGADGGAKTPARSDPIMAHMAKGLSDAQIQGIAVAVAKLACDGGQPQAKRANPPVMPQAGKRCAPCHGVGGIGRKPYIPNVAGQQRAYLRRQLLLIRETAWGAKPLENESWRSHPIMERQAARISIAEVDALARYYASLDCRGAGAAAR